MFSSSATVKVEMRGRKKRFDTDFDGGKLGKKQLKKLRKRVDKKRNWDESI